MPCHTRMKSIFLRGLLWLYLLELGFMLVSSEPGYLDFDNLPDTNFSCAWRIVGGYYADVEAACQMFHVCTLGQNNETMDIRFLCLNGTVFDQSTRVCERIDEVDCEKSEQYYDNNRELYGNSAPLIIPGDPDSGPPSTTTTTTTTTTRRPKYYSTATPRQANTPHYYTTAKPKPIPTLQKLSLHHHQFSSDSPPDFRFNPKEINLKLNSDASLDIKPVSYQQQRFNDDKSHHTIVTTHSYNKEDAKNKKNIDVNYDFDYQDDKNYPNYQSTGAGAEEEYEDDYKHHEESSTARGISTPPSHQGYHFQRADRPPVNPPLVYSSLSSPSPFAHNTGNKRHSDPKIKKSVSVSISDQNGKELAKLNNTSISAIFSDSYLDYTEEEVTLLPLFEDVPRVKPHRTKRTIDSEVLSKRPFNMTEKEAADVLRFLLNWYTGYEKTTKKVTIPLSAETITEINEELSPTILNKTITTAKPRKVSDVTEILEAKASKMAVEFEKYLEEDYQDYLYSVKNQTSKEDVNRTSPDEYIEYDYYYDDEDNTTNSQEHLNVDDIAEDANTTNARKELEQSKLTESNEIRNKLQETEKEQSVGAEPEEGDVKENDDSNAVEIPLYEYVDDNYEAKTFNKEDVKLGKIDVDEYVDDNYETSKNEVPAEMKKIENEDPRKFTTTIIIPTIDSNIEVGTKEYFEATKVNEIYGKSVSESTTQSYKDQVITEDAKELHQFEVPAETTTNQSKESTERTSLESIPETTVVITESTTDLNFMIRDIEKHTKSVAANILMPSHAHSAHLAQTEVKEESKVPTEVTTANFEESIPQNEKGLESISLAPKPIETTESTRFYTRGRGKSMFTMVTSSENKSSENDTVASPKDVIEEVVRSSRGRGRSRFGIVSSSTHLPTAAEEIHITEPNLTLMTTQSLTKDITMHLEETVTPALPITEIPTEIVNSQDHSFSSLPQTETVFVKEEIMIDMITTPKEAVSEGDEISSRSIGGNNFGTSKSTTPKIEETQIKENILAVTATPKVISDLNKDSPSTNEDVSSHSHLSTDLPEILHNEEGVFSISSTTDRLQIDGIYNTTEITNPSDSESNVLEATKDTIVEPEITEIPPTVTPSKETEIVEEQKKIEEHPSSHNWKKDDHISRSSTTNQTSRVFVRNRGRNRTGGSSISNTSPMKEMIYSELAESTTTSRVIELSSTISSQLKEIIAIEDHLEHVSSSSPRSQEHTNAEEISHPSSTATSHRVYSRSRARNHFNGNVIPRTPTIKQKALSYVEESSQIPEAADVLSTISSIPKEKSEIRNHLEHKIADSSLKSDDRVRDKAILHSTTERSHRFSPRSRSRNYFHRSSTSGTSTTTNKVLSIIEEGNLESEAMGPPITTASSLSKEPIEGEGNFSWGTPPVEELKEKLKEVSSEMEGNSQISLLKISSVETVKPNETFSDEEHTNESDEVLVTTSATTEASSVTAKPTTRNSRLGVSLPRTEDEILSTESAPTIVPSRAVLEDIKIEDIPAHEDAEWNSSEEAADQNKLNKIVSTPNEILSTTEEIATTITIPNIDDIAFNEEKPRSALNNLFKKKYKSYSLHEKPVELKTSREREGNNFDKNAGTTGPSISNEVPTTEEILTTITVPENDTSEEIISSTLLPEKPLIDILGYSTFNKVSETDDSTLRELGYFSIPKTAATIQAARSYNGRGRGRHRFNIVSSTVLPKSGEFSRIDGISTTSEYAELPNTSTPETKEDLKIDLPQYDETTEEVLTTIAVPKLLENTIITTRFTQRRREYHRFNVVPTTSFQNEGAITEGLSTIIPNVVEIDQPGAPLQEKVVSSVLPQVDEVSITEEIPSTTSKPKLMHITSSRSRTKGRHRFSVIPESTTSKLKDKSKGRIVTDPSLVRSANPTLPRNNFKPTTPLTRVVKIRMRKQYVFTCLDKRVNRFYSDPRDCRLFHYCSPGYTSNQLVDMKFVCDLGTYYDDIKRICTKQKPTRCV